MKKITSLLLLIVLFTASVMAQTIEYPKIQIKKNKFLIGNCNVLDGWSLNDIKKEINDNDRRREGYNITHSYDNAGIVLFEAFSNKKPTGNILEIQIHFIPEVNDVNPKKGYGKEIKIDKLVVSKDLTPDKMLKTLKKWKKTESYLDHSYRMSNGKIYIYFQFNESENKLMKISIGKDSKN